MLSIYKKEVIPEEFKCVRLADNHDNKGLIQGFSCEYNPSLAMYLNQEAWGEEQNNYRAYYLVKEKNKIVCYFSLQCGLLVKCHKKEVGGITQKELDGYKGFFIDQDKIHVTKTLPAIELSHFCINDSYRRKKKSWIISNGIASCTVGEYIFYEFIAPKIIHLSEIVGIQYLYLFCADNGIGKLRNYYEQVLHFKLMDDMACIRSEYDDKLDCYILKIKDLKIDTELFRDCKRAIRLVENLHTSQEISNYQAKRVYEIQNTGKIFDLLVKQGRAKTVAKNDKGSIVRIQSI